MIVLLEYRDSATTAGDYDMSCIGKGADGINFYDINRVWRSNDTAEALTRNFYYIIALFTFSGSVFCVHDTSDNLGWCIECFVIWINSYLCDNGAYAAIDAASDQFFANRILQVVSDVTLRHSRAD